MSFLNLPFLLVMGIPLVIFGYLILTDKDRFLEIFEPKVLARLSLVDDALPLKGRKLLLLVAIFWMMVAMARPVIDHGDEKIVLDGLPAVVALDISASMRAKDCYPNRLSCAKQKIIRLFDQMPYDDLSLIAFAKTAFMVAPFSSDKRILKEMVEGITPEYISMGSTNFQALGTLVERLLTGKKEKILILFTDGEASDKLEEFGNLVQQLGIVPYVVLIGSRVGSPVLDQKGNPLIYQGRIPITQRNDQLGKLAQSLGGAYVVATTGEGDIKNLVKVIKKTHKNQTKQEILIHHRTELFYYPLGLGVLFLLFSFISIPSKEEFQYRLLKPWLAWRRKYF